MQFGLDATLDPLPRSLGAATVAVEDHQRVLEPTREGPKERGRVNPATRVALLMHPHLVVDPAQAQGLSALQESGDRLGNALVRDQQDEVATQHGRTHPAKPEENRISSARRPRLSQSNRKYGCSAPLTTSVAPTAFLARHNTCSGLDRFRKSGE